MISPVRGFDTCAYTFDYARKGAGSLVLRLHGPGCAEMTIRTLTHFVSAKSSLIHGLILPDKMEGHW